MALERKWGRVMADQDPIRVALVDDHELVRVGLADLLRGYPDLTVVGQAASVAEAMARMTDTTVDVLLLDVRLPDGSGIDVCAAWRVQQPATRIIMLTSYSEPEELFRALGTGAAGYLLKSTRGPDLLAAIRTVHAGGTALDPSLAPLVIERAARGAPPDPLEGLSPRERSVLTLIADGRTNREIAEQLSLSETTVKHYVSNLLGKMGWARRAEAAAFLARLDRGNPKPG